MLARADQPLAAAQLSPQCRVTSRGTLSDAALVKASRITASTRAFSFGGASTTTSSWTWRMSRACSSLGAQLAIQAHERGLEDVGRESLDARVHGLAFGGLTLRPGRRAMSGNGRMRPNSVRE